MDFAEDWCGLEDWQAGARYQLRRLIGSGSYGDVAEGLDVKTNQPVAIKRVQNIVESVVDAKRIYREIYILGKMSHPNVIRLISVEAPLLSPQISDPNTPPPSDKVLSNENNSDEGHRKRWRTQKLPDSNQDHALDDLYMVFELVDTDLNKLLLSAQYLSTLHIQTFLYQILLGVHYLHSANVIHRDLKPANILLYENCDLKICDFGLSRLYNDPTADINNSNLKSVISENGIMNDSEGNHLKRTLSTSASKESIDAPRRPARNRSRSTDFGMSDMLAAIPQRVRKMTNHVVTRWYRAPELILLCDYTKAVDMWSVGCIMAELLGMMVESISDYQDRTPLFPGTSCPSLSGDGLDNIDPFGSTTTSQQGQGKETEYDRLDQLNLILDVIGTPSEEDVRAIQNPAKERYLLEQMPFRNAQNLSDKYPGAPAEALDLLAQMLHFNPVKRLTVEEALAHPYLSPVRDLSEETVFEGILKMDIETTPLVSSDEIRENVLAS